MHVPMCKKWFLQQKKNRNPSFDLPSSSPLRPRCSQGRWWWIYRCVVACHRWSSATVPHHSWGRHRYHVLSRVPSLEPIAACPIETAATAPMLIMWRHCHFRAHARPLAPLVAGGAIASCAPTEQGVRERGMGGDEGCETIDGKQRTWRER